MYSNVVDETLTLHSEPHEIEKAKQLAREQHLEVEWVILNAHKLCGCIVRELHADFAVVPKFATPLGQMWVYAWTDG